MIYLAPNLIPDQSRGSQYSYLKYSKSAFRHLKLINQGGIEAVDWP